MPLGKAVPLLLLTSLFAAACASAPAPEGGMRAAVVFEQASPATAQMPREIRLGLADMIIQRVEPEVTREEVMAAIAPMIRNAPICLRWPALWMERARGASFVVRYDLMARDWGEAAAASARARMTEFIEMGLLQVQSEAVDGSVVYVLTSSGSTMLHGAIEPGQRPSFCGPAERRLVAIEAMERGQYPCGTLSVRFTHDGSWPSWLSAETTRGRLAPTWPASGAVAGGSVSLSRQWFARQALPPGARNGALRSACFDARRQEIVGDDLALSLPAD